VPRSAGAGATVKNILAVLLIAYAVALLGYRLCQFIPGEIAEYQSISREHDALVHAGKIPVDPTLWHLVTFRQ
jgi:hypothetical protein